MSIVGGEERDVAAVAAEVMSCRARFFDGSGVTLTGGEVTIQPDAAVELLTQLKATGINTCIETNGISPRLPALFPHHKKNMNFAPQTMSVGQNSSAPTSELIFFETRHFFEGYFV